MTLTAEQIRALAPAQGYKQIDRYLPDPYRRALSDTKTPLGAVTRSWRDGLKRLDHELGLVQRSRSVAFFTDLDDGRRLGAMHDQTPWEEEDTEAFRIRLAEVARLAAAGAASARRMLSLVGLSSSAELVEVIPPDRASYTLIHGETSVTGATGQGQTRGYFKKPDISATADAPAIPGALFHADVIDAPNRLYEQDAKLLPGAHYIFRLRNTASATLPTLLGAGERTYPDPVFTLEADEDIGPLILIQSFNDAPKRAPRAIVINRRLRAGSKLDIDVAAMQWNHDAGTATILGPWKLGDKKPALMGGMTEIATARSRFDNEPGDPAAGYALTLRAPDGLDFSGLLEDQMVDKGAIDPGSIQMPSLLGQSISTWRVLRILPDPDGSTNIHDARFQPLPRDAKLKISARWRGRRAGEFAVAVEDQYLDTATNGPLPHRVLWLDQMIERFKLAGTVRVEPLLEDLFAGQSEIALELKLESAAKIEVTFEFENWGELSSGVSVEDTLELLTEFPIQLESPIRIEDEITVLNEGSVIELEDTLRSGDEIELIPQSNTALESAVRMDDRFDLTIIDVPREPPVTDTRPTDDRIVLPNDGDITRGGVSRDDLLGGIVRDGILGGGILGGITQPLREGRITGDPGLVTPGGFRPTGGLIGPVAPVRPLTLNFSERIRLGDRMSLRRPTNR